MEKIIKIRFMFGPWIDAANARNFMGICEWLSRNFTEQEIKSFSNLGKGFFGGWIDPPPEALKATNEKTTRRRL